MVLSHCEDCGQILKGRCDKKFCSDHCRVHYHNSLNRKTRLFVNQVNKILKRNKKIMEQFYLAGQLQVSREAMLAAGFSFEYFTHQELMDNNKKYCFCYEYGYLCLPGNVVLQRMHTEHSECE